jgi:YHS domain-containing protein
MGKGFLLIAALALCTAVSFSQDATAIRKKHFNLSKSGLAIEGYDPVAYFKANKAIEGKKEFAVNYQGAAYYFSTADNKEAFIKNPSIYEPQYGGWCAYAMGKTGFICFTIDFSTIRLQPGIRMRLI